mmetsp:Transcript_57719/g.148480  ORF Transcript_57719/g.148480 Transcript_57719/m.148480 type:complete len:152 (-) Transcript_57719:375-830(-)
MQLATEATQQPEVQAPLEQTPCVTSDESMKQVRSSRTAMLPVDDDDEAPAVGMYDMRPSRTAMFPVDEEAVAEASKDGKDERVPHKSRTAMLPALNDIRVSRTAMFEADLAWTSEKNKANSSEESMGKTWSSSVHQFFGRTVQKVLSKDRK